MAKFCTKCGRPLEEGEVCNCNTNTVVTPVNTNNNTNNTDYKQYVDKFLDVVKNIFTKPIDTIKKYTSSENSTFGILAILVNCIVMGIFTYLVAKELTGSLSVLGLGSLSSLSGYGKIELPFFDTFIRGFLYQGAYLLCLAGMTYLLANKLFKSNFDFKKALSLFGTVSVYNTITVLVILICMYISLKLMLIVLLITSLFYTVYLYHGTKEVCGVEDNKVAFVYVPSISVAIFVVVYLLPKIFS